MFGNDFVLALKKDMNLKDDEVFPIYDTIKEKLCPYFGKFVGPVFSVLFIDKTLETNTVFSYEVLQKLMTGWYIPVNSFLLFMGRKRVNYYEQAVNQYVNENNIEFGKEFCVDTDTGEPETCMIYRNFKLFRYGQEDREFLFRYILKI